MGFTDRTQIYASAESVSTATATALDLCRQHGFTSVVLPALGTGVGGLDDEACASAMVAAVVEHLADETSLRRIRFCVNRAERAEIFSNAISTQLGHSS
jgi:O-acetyl-ADP-ribose deacetylase (regulator of RNase III)